MSANNLNPPPVGRLDVLLPRLLAIGTAVGGIAASYGFAHPLIDVQLAAALQVALVTLYVLDVWVGARFGRLAVIDRKPGWPEVCLHGSAALGVMLWLLDVEAGWTAFELIVVALLLRVLWQLNVVIARRISRPGLLLPVGFAVLIFAGTALLKLPLALAPGRQISWLDAFFTITSAVCVTGLVVHNTATHFSPFGHFIIGLFIQLGGLGIVTFGSVVAMLLGSKLSLRENLDLSEALNDQPLGQIRRLIVFVVLTTLGFELLGAAVMLPLWHGDLSFEQRAGLSLFHAVSAYCNAGFDLTGSSMVPYRYHFLAHGVIAPLLVIGGLGYPVMDNLVRVASWRWRQWRAQRTGERLRDQPTLAARQLTLHTRLALTTTAGLYLAGMLLLLAGQLSPWVLDQMQLNVTANRAAPAAPTATSLVGMWCDASFMSLTARTAGFNTMPMDEIRPAGVLTLVGLMLVGGSPGGTAGGMRTTTLAILLLSVIATVRKLTNPEAFGRRIDDILVRKAAVLAALYLGTVGVATLLLCFSEPFPLQKLLFEATSAVTVTGLSLGITGDLTSFGKGVLIVAMFLGRVGPLAVLTSLTFGRWRPRPGTLPREDVMLT